MRSGTTSPSGRRPARTAAAVRSPTGARRTTATRRSRRCRTSPFRPAMTTPCSSPIRVIPVRARGLPTPCLAELFRAHRRLSGRTHRARLRRSEHTRSLASVLGLAGLRSSHRRPHPAAADDECTEESCNYYLYVINTGALPIKIADFTFTPSILSEAEREDCEPPNTGRPCLPSTQASFACLW